MKLVKMIRVVEVHGAGNAAQVITGGVNYVPGATMFEKMTYMQEHGAPLRKLFLTEPRGYPAMCCNVLLPPTVSGADAGFVILLQTGVSPMSGSNILCVATALVETGMVPVQEPTTRLVLELPAGLVQVEVEVSNGKAGTITYVSVPSFAVHLDAQLEVPGYGTVVADVAWGGVFCVIVPAASVGLELAPERGRQIVQLGEMVRVAANEQLAVSHPENPAFAEIKGAVLTGPAVSAGATSRNATVLSLGAARGGEPAGILDRSPCGTGTCARMAAMHAKGQLREGEKFVHESIVGTTMTGDIQRLVAIGPYQGVVIAVSGRAWITGFADYVVEESDPFPEGFTLADLW